MAADFGILAPAFRPAFENHLFSEPQIPPLRVASNQRFANQQRLGFFE
jgi:hypothetical protein